jgi:RimJ/RimL family protein N-acetyltransferase
MQPVLDTPRLLLRPFVPADAPEVQRLAGDARVAETTLAIPHPYPDGAAAAWIASHAAGWADGSEISWAIVRREDGALLGAAALMGINARHASAELGYWVGHEHWGLGYASEAARALAAFADGQLGLSRVVGRCLARNPASARVLEKAGLRAEGRLVRHLYVGGVFEDVLLFGWVRPSRLG